MSAKPDLSVLKTKWLWRGELSREEQKLLLDYALELEGAAERGQRQQSSLATTPEIAERARGERGDKR